MDKIDRLKKLHTLAMKGVDGEKENAQKILEELLKKYDVTLSELESNDEKIENFTFWYKGEAERQILAQIHYKVTDNSTYYRLYKNERLSKTMLRFKCTKSQKVEIEFLFDFYKRLWEEEYQIFLDAFICKHRLFGNGNDSKEDSNPDLDRYERILSMMQSLKEASPLLVLNEGVEEE